MRPIADIIGGPGPFRAGGPLLGLLLGLGVAAPGAAQEFVVAAGRLDDAAFYRAVACAAPPGGACGKPFLRWPADRRGALTVALAPLAGGGRAPEAYRRGVAAALAQVNALDAGVHLRLAEGEADIAVHVVDTPPGHVIRGTGVAGLDGERLPLGRVWLRTREGLIGSARIAISTWAGPREAASILLEEIVQAMGLITDIKGAAHGDLLFSEEGNSVVRLAGQDAMALRRHYAQGGLPEER